MASALRTHTCASYHPAHPVLYPRLRFHIAAHKWNFAACFRSCIEPAATAGESVHDGVLFLSIGASTQQAMLDQHRHHDFEGLPPRRVRTVVQSPGEHAEALCRLLEPRVGDKRRPAWRPTLRLRLECHSLDGSGRPLQRSIGRLSALEIGHSKGPPWLGRRLRMIRADVKSQPYQTTHHNQSPYQCGINCEYHVKRFLTRNDHQQGQRLNRHGLRQSALVRHHRSTISNKPPDQSRAFRYTLASHQAYIRRTTLLQEHEHCRPRTLPCAASFLQHSGPLHWKQDTTQPSITR